MNRSANIACHSLIRHWIQKHEAGQLIDVRIAEYEGQELERKMGLEKGAAVDTVECVKRYFKTPAGMPWRLLFIA